MSATKKVLGNFNIKTIGTESNIHVTTHTMFVHGNLFVAGEQTTVTSNNSSITDNIITLNAGWNLPPTLNAGIEVERGFIANVAVPHARIIWDESDDAWKLDDGVSIRYILTSATSSDAGLEKVEDDPVPKLGGNLNVNQLSIFDANAILGNSISIQSNTILSLSGQTIRFNASSQPVSLATNVPAGGATGLYVTNSQVTNEELITKSRAIVYSIIF